MARKKDQHVRQNNGLITMTLPRLGHLGTVPHIADEYPVLDGGQ
jgi:hypothetical protein